MYVLLLLFLSLVIFLFSSPPNKKSCSLDKNYKVVPKQFNKLNYIKNEKPTKRKAKPKVVTGDRPGPTAPSLATIIQHCMQPFNHLILF